ncbi:hypothetical protein KAT67_07650 [candidate division WOR-3 bacterium]|nr:hypothetical protein [candidate division WOR-3 bacterium]
MITKIEGEKYNYEIVSKNEDEDLCFFIRAIDKLTGRFSCINNLNAILSEFNIGIDDPKVEDSMWVLTKEDVRYLRGTAKQFLSDPSFRNYLERQLDEDRTLGEWENKIILTT